MKQHCKQTESELKYGGVYNNHVAQLCPMTSAGVPTLFSSLRLLARLHETDVFPPFLVGIGVSPFSGCL